LIAIPAVVVGFRRGATIGSALVVMRGKPISHAGWKSLHEDIS
jgi:hypothetical protein